MYICMRVCDYLYMCVCVRTCARVCVRVHAEASIPFGASTEDVDDSDDALLPLLQFRPVLLLPLLSLE